MILPPEHGMVCLTFDDGRYTEWLAQLSLFAEYDAHATFFYNGIPDKAALDSMKQLRSAGHAVGIHTVHHKDADGMTAENGNDYLQNEIFPQLEAMKQAGIEANYFAYPNNARTAYSEQVMGRYFRHCRAGLLPSPEKGFRIADQPQAFLAFEDIAGTLTLGGCGIGEYYASTNDNLDAALEHAAGEKDYLFLPKMNSPRSFRRAVSVGSAASAAARAPHSPPEAAPKSSAEAFPAVKPSAPRTASAALQVSD